MAVLSGGRKGPKTNGGRSHSQDKRVPREASEGKKFLQLSWRIECLKTRMRNGTATAKNIREFDKIIQDYPLVRGYLQPEYDAAVSTLAA